jgi:26S proteasome regulatory subunit T5
MNTKLPYMVATVGELVDPFEEESKDGSGMSNQTSKLKGKALEEAKANAKAVVVKTTSRQSFYLPNTGLLEAKDLKPGELIAVNNASYVVYEKLPPEYDSRVKAMEVDERPTEEYSDIGGLDKQIEELVEAIVLPMTQKDRF